MNNKVNVKVVLLGKEYGGKTSVVERFLHDKFCGELPYQNTIGAAYGAKRVEVFGRYIVMGIWDTAGSERYQAMSRIYYRDAWAAVVCYDLTDVASWEKVKFWVNELQQYEPNCRIYFCGTKKDLIGLNGTTPIETHVVQMFAKNFTRECPIFETSSKTGENIDELFLRIAKDFVKDNKETPRRNDSTNGTNPRFQLDGPVEKKPFCSACS